MTWLGTRPAGALDDVTASASTLRRFLHGLPGVDQVGAEARAAALATRSIKTTAKAYAIDLAIRTGLRNREDLIRTDTDLASIRDTPEFRARILPVAELGTTRVEGWRMDIDYLTKRVAETHYAPFKNISQAEWNQETARIKASVPEATAIAWRVWTSFATSRSRASTLGPRMKAPESMTSAAAFSSSARRAVCCAWRSIAGTSIVRAAGVSDDFMRYVTSGP